MGPLAAYLEQTPITLACIENGRATQVYLRTCRNRTVTLPVSNVELLNARTSVATVPRSSSQLPERHDVTLGPARIGGAQCHAAFKTYLSQAGIGSMIWFAPLTGVPALLFDVNTPLESV